MIFGGFDWYNAIKGTFCMIYRGLKSGVNQSILTEKNKKF
jgi:hypothetical protein